MSDLARQARLPPRFANTPVKPRPTIAAASHERSCELIGVSLRSAAIVHWPSGRLEPDRRRIADTGDTDHVGSIIVTWRAPRAPLASFACWRGRRRPNHPISGSFAADQGANRSVRDLPLFLRERTQAKPLVHAAR